MNTNALQRESYLLASGINKGYSLSGILNILYFEVYTRSVSPSATTMLSHLKAISPTKLLQFQNILYNSGCALL